jgi:hypothetical protein
LAGASRQRAPRQAEDEEMDVSGLMQRMKPRAFDPSERASAQ